MTSRTPPAVARPEPMAVAHAAVREVVQHYIFAHGCAPPIEIVAQVSVNAYLWATTQILQLSATQYAMPTVVDIRRALQDGTIPWES